MRKEGPEITTLVDEFWTAIQNNDTDIATTILGNKPTFAGKNFNPESLHTEGFPLYHAARFGNFALVKQLLEHGADPDAKLNTEDHREIGMPLIHAYEGGHFDIVHLLLDYKADLNASPYCSTPFVDCVYNATWNEPGQAELVQKLVSNSFANFLPNKSLVDVQQDASTSSENIKLLHRLVTLGGQPSLFTVVRHQHHELIKELLTASPLEKGPATDWPQGTVLDNIAYGASWCGYPKTLAMCREICPVHYTTDSAKHAINRAIRSHNRDSDIDDYAQLIQQELDYLGDANALTQTFSNGDPFLPLHLLADDFIKNSHYGFKCERLSNENDLIRIAKLFVSSGYEPNFRSPKDQSTPLAIADAKGRTQYASYLRENGALN